MKRLFMQNTYLVKHNAVVTKISQGAHGTYVQLNETIFHPKGGGQPDDSGTINGVSVIKLVDEDDEIKHYLDSAAQLSFEVGHTVQLTIDVAKRTEHAALHSTGHILHGVLLSPRYGLGPQTACNHFPQQASVTYKANGNPMPDIKTLTQDIQAIIERRTPLRIITVDGERYLEVDGYAPVRCGGTHIKNAAELTDFAIRGIKYDKKSDTFRVSYKVDYKKSLTYGTFFKEPPEAEQQMQEVQGVLAEEPAVTSVPGLSAAGPQPSDTL
jgi:alanyl-tRNA synthetase